MKKRFISPVTTVIIILLMAVSFAGAYGVYKYEQLAGEKETMEQLIAEQKEKELHELREKVEQLESEDKSTSSEINLAEENVVLFPFYTEPIIANIRPCTDIVSSGCAPVGQYKQNTEINLPYDNISKMPEWIPVEWEGSGAFISKSVLSEKKVSVGTSKPPSKIISAEEQEKPEVEITSDLNKEPNTDLTIFNVDTYESGDSTYITWETSISSDSRIVIDGDFYVSDESDSNEHSVSFSDLSGNTVINYEIVAESGSLESSKFGKFTTRQGDLNATFAYSKDEDCIVVIIEDDNQNAQPGVPIKITSDWYSPSGMRYLNDTVTQNTTSWGEVSYCEPNIENIKVQNTSTEKVYYDGILPLYW